MFGTECANASILNEQEFFSSMEEWDHDMIYMSLQVYLDIKCAKDPEVKVPIVVLPAPRRPAEKHPSASAGIGLEAFGGPVQSQRTSLAQQAALYGDDQPPSYEACTTYPPFPEWTGRQSLL